MKTAVLLNGPPGVGKDTIGKLFAEATGFQLMAFKNQLYQDTAAYFGVVPDQLITRNNDREQKEQIWDRLRLKVPFLSAEIALTPRESLIFVSENVIKPREGITYFGDAAVRRCQEGGLDHVIFTDSGFPHETQPVVAAFENVFIVHLYRDGCSFAGDSRHYVEGFPNTLRLDLEPGRPDLAVKQIHQIVFPAAEHAA